MKIKKRVLAGILSLCLVGTALPVTAMAAEITELPISEWYFPQKLKIGDTIRELSTQPGEGDLVTVGKMSNLPEDIKAIFCRDIYNYRVHAVDVVEDVVDGQALIKTDLSRALRPGIWDLDVIGINAEGEERIVNLRQHNVKEPVINTNAPENVQVGQSIQLSTELTNTSLANTKVAPYLNPENYVYYDEEVLGGMMYGKSSENPASFVHEIAYLPKVEVIEGAELVEQSNQDYGNILNSSEALTFKGKGTVKLKITYQQIMTCGECEGTWRLDESGKPVELESDKRYSPETTIVINVVEPVSVTDEKTGIQLDAESGVVPADTTMRVENIKEGERFDAVKDTLMKKADKFQAFDISLISGGQVIQPNGKVKIQIPVPAGFNPENLALYHVADSGKAVEMDFTLTDGKKSLSFETDHFSIYALAELKQQNASENNDDQSTSPETGHKSDLPLLLVLLFVSGGAVLSLSSLSRKKKAQ